METSQLPPEVLENIKKYSRYKNKVICLNCGYIGPMGIKEDVNINYWPGIIIGTVVGVAGQFLFGIPSIISGALVGAIFVLATFKVITICPKCEASIIIRRCF